ncbi:S-adenosyl-L-methionine-dependent methyltransferase [Fistulina hepatica ATCC 64428]|uniref:S-adenosyl-L-methionine-dependent methyltransferase n=1 Tax=Fistulina hepatica ATCC 64428 TaxID=1128425 RepID=A0A0D7AIW9_9AGAR|nr:S-adenosyl-L-methionine-dependent methyltransferase [Fistulina hepatica ATCC 64428]
MNFYFGAAKALDRLDAREGSVKGVLATLPEKDRKRTAALVIETLKYKLVLGDVIDRAELMKSEHKLKSKNLVLVLVHDLLLSGGGIQAGDGPLKQAILRHKTRLRAELQKVKVKFGVSSNADLANEGDQRAVQIPRYVRVNTNIWSMNEAITFFKSRGYVLSTDGIKSDKDFVPDEHIPDLLHFPHKVSFHDDEAYRTGKIILQDKASCIPAFVLDPPSDPSAVVIDATAAPGNKTSHLSALMKNKGKLYAFEKDRRRFQTLKTMLAKAGCKNTEACHADFLTVDPKDVKYSPATHILVDPSCSGSGIVNRLDYLLETEEEGNGDEESSRLSKLASFQEMMIKHAMKFPNVQRIVYSTCSVHATENEHVVRSVLQSDLPEAQNFTLEKALPSWHRRGLPDEFGSSDADNFVRCSPGEDATNGFFVSCFVRRSLAPSPDQHAPSKKRIAAENAEPDLQLSEPPRKKKKKSKKKCNTSALVQDDEVKK